MVEALLAIVVGLLMGLGSVGLARLAGSMKEALAALGILELWIPAMSLMDYVHRTAIADPMQGVISTGYAITVYLLYVAFWSVGAVLGSMIERIAEEAGYVVGSSLRHMMW